MPPLSTHQLQFDVRLESIEPSLSPGCHESFIPLSQWERVDCVLHTSLMHLLCKLLIPSHHNVRPDIFIHEHTRSPQSPLRSIKTGVLKPPCTPVRILK